MVASNDVNTRVKKHRTALRAAGLRPIQIWVPDTRSSGFAEEARRQCAIVAAADAGDCDLGGVHGRCHV
ncbi:antitoxin MazE family protein [Halomonas daqingensis]|uniref:Antitoxin MazE family protein n=2 Tax=Billgrantia desiderata TaxID=52021 RepID=A0ABS9BD14_9GAMM|nr:antitoxin MazE family protein [Halomonas desiderata]MCE8049648.1 antitoxin MazE family protein [Halomonas desiderata]